MSDTDAGESERIRPAGTIQWGRVAAYAVLTVITLYLLSRLKQIFLLFYLALLIGFAINSFVLWLERRRVPRSMAVIGLVLVFIAALVAIGFWIVPPAIAQAQKLLDDYPLLYQRAQNWINGVLARYPELRQQIEQEGGTSLQNLTPRAGGIVRQIGSFAVSFGTLIFSAFILFFLVVFALIDPQPMARSLFDLTPTRLHDRIERTLRQVQDKVVAWVGGTLILMAIVGSLVYAGLLVINVPNALLFGIIAAIGEGIPTLGPILSAIPPIIVLLLTDPMKALWVALLFVVVQQLENNLIVPTVMGNRLEVHPWGLIFMMLVMGELFGLIGIFLATPTTAILGVVYQELIPKPGKRDTVPATYRVARVVGGIEGDFNDTC
ncbi:MAG: AI-2E family transporter [Armatimonadetes bacterium]|nr:AI-2E family transporter [Armatimonadota bacterium]